MGRAEAKPIDTTARECDGFRKGSTHPTGYIATSHGGNILLKSRDPSDYQVTILETVGSMNEDQLDNLESRWKRKLQSREMGLNAN